MSAEKDIEISIQRMAGTYLKDIIQIFMCNVVSVDKVNRTVDCTPIGSDSTTDLPKVLLCAENSNGLVVFPNVGSSVIVALSARNIAYVTMFSDIDSVQFADGSFGGMVKLVDPSDSNSGILARINNIENTVNDFINKWNAFCTAYVPGSPSTTGLPASLSTSHESNLVVTIRAELENINILQGK